MAKRDRTVATRLARAHLVIANALEDSYIMEEVARYNYDEPRVREGLGKLFVPGIGKRNKAFLLNAP